MSFTILDVTQRSPEWHAARLGRLTGSRAADMLSTLRNGGEAAGRRNLRIQLVLERITGRSQENGYQSPAMAQGIEREVDAAAVYESLTGQLLSTTGFLVHDSLMAGCSLDGATANFAGIIEIKCPQPPAHLDVLRSGRIPGGYMGQVVHNLWISNADWCDWVSFSPEFPPPLHVKLLRIHRHDVDIAAYELAARLFLSEVDREEETVRKMAERVAV